MNAAALLVVLEGRRKVRAERERRKRRRARFGQVLRYRVEVVGIEL